MLNKEISVVIFLSPRNNSSFSMISRLYFSLTLTSKLVVVESDFFFFVESDFSFFSSIFFKKKKKKTFSSD